MTNNMKVLNKKKEAAKKKLLKQQAVSTQLKQKFNNNLIIYNNNKIIYGTRTGKLYELTRVPLGKRTESEILKTGTEIVLKNIYTKTSMREVERLYNNEYGRCWTYGGEVYGVKPGRVDRIDEGPEAKPKVNLYDVKGYDPWFENLKMLSIDELPPRNNYFFYFNYRNTGKNIKYDYNNRDLEKKNRKFHIIYDYSKSPVYSNLYNTDSDNLAIYNYIKDNRLKRKNLYNTYTNKNVFLSINNFFNFKKKIKVNYTFTNDFLTISKKRFLLHNEQNKKLYLIRPTNSYIFIDYRKIFNFVLDDLTSINNHENIYSTAGVHTVYSTINETRIGNKQTYLYLNLCKRNKLSSDPLHVDNSIIRLNISDDGLTI